MDWLIDAIMEHIDELLLEGNFERVDSICKTTNEECEDIDILLTVLTITLAAKDKLPSRAALYLKAEAKTSWNPAMVRGLG